MDFARKQLEKYGWTDGKGLGKNENGISEALKPKLKRSVTGVGHDAAADFTEHWWETLYNKAAGNVEVKNKKGKTKKIKTSSDDFQISNSTWKLTQTKRKTNSDEEQYADYFVKKATLTNGGVKMEKVADTDSDSEDEQKDVFKMTDEELFAACGGRTAHKGARHGLRALGKLARIEQQEQILLEQPKYEGYSHAKKKKNKNKPASELLVENLSLNSDTDVPKIKKKKKKRCSNNENVTEIGNGNIEVAESVESVPEKIKKKRKVTDENVAIVIQEDDGRESKKSKPTDENVASPEVGCLFKSKKKKKKGNVNTDIPSGNEAESKNFLKTEKYEFLDNGVVRKTRKKNKKVKS